MKGLSIYIYFNVLEILIFFYGVWRRYFLFFNFDFFKEKENFFFNLEVEFKREGKKFILLFFL